MERRDDPWKNLFGFTPEDFFEDFERMFDELFSHLDDESEPAVWGFSVSQRPGEEPEIRRFGNVRSRGESYDVEGDRTPLIDVFDHEDDVQVIVEMPGVSREDIELDASDTRLRIRAEGELRKYNEAVKLPPRVDPESASAEYRNGVLQVTLEKSGESHRVDVK